MLSQLVSIKNQRDALAQRQEAIEENRINDLIDRFYKIKAMEGKLNPPPFVKDVPGYGDVTLEEFKALPNETKEYISHVLAARALGEKPMTMEEFDKLKHKDRITSAMEASIARYMNETGKIPPDSKLEEWTKKYKTPSVQVNVGDAVKKAKALSDVKAQAKVVSPEFLMSLEKKAKNDPSLDKYKYGTKEYDRAWKRNVIIDLDRAIRNAFRGSKITYDKSGWYADGKLVRRNPYAE